MQAPLLEEPKDQDVAHRIFAYGDSRTGVLLIEDQDNAGEAVHDWVATQMIERLRHGKGEVVFTGDAVYAGGAKFHWANFVRIVDKFRVQHVPYFPCIGNHELLAGIVGVISPWFEEVEAADDDVAAAKALALSKAEDPADREWKEFLIERHQKLKEAGHNPKNLPEETRVQLNAKSKGNQDKLLSKMEQNALSKDARTKVAAGQRLMDELYVKSAKLDYLAPFFRAQKRTFYSVQLTDPKPTVLMIMLDTNSLDWEPQWRWFSDELAQSKHDLIIVFGHHPPGTVAGWERYERHLREHKTAVLWVFSHVHAFEYYFPKTPDLSRALFISGGGGASLEECDEESVPIHGWKYGPPQAASGRLYHFLDIRVTQESVFVTVVACSKKDEPMTPRATYKLKLPGRD